MAEYKGPIALEVYPTGLNPIRTHPDSDVSYSRPCRGACKCPSQCGRC